MAINHHRRESFAQIMTAGSWINVETHRVTVASQGTQLGRHLLDQTCGDRDIPIVRLMIRATTAPTVVAMTLLVALNCGCQGNTTPSQSPSTPYRSETAKHSKPEPFFPIQSTAESEQMRKTIGAPIGWHVSVVQQHQVRKHDREVTHAILQMMTADDKYPYRLALATGTDAQSLHIQIDSICSEGFADYCESMYDQVPTSADIEEFAVRYGY